MKLQLYKYLCRLMLSLMWLAIHADLQAQCASPINAYPYTEDFEAGNGNWVRSSTDHWEWGQIFSKPVITSAASGSRCWLVGGFSGSSYSSGSSYLQSPCFDISSLADPEISFSIFWETERRFDGLSFQYSLDAGANWSNLGSINSNSSCEGTNWFNFDPVNFVGGPGWTGNIQATTGSCVGGGGSAAWLTARHSLSSIAGATGVLFRFVFAAGTTCNEFDGVAIDDVKIGEAIPDSAGFNFTCNAAISATFTSSIAGCIAGLSWDFGDPASGSNNSSTIENPTHVFSAPGNYDVSLTVNFVSGVSVFVTKPISVFAVSATILNTIKCNGSQTGAITVNADPPGTYTYSWDTNPVQNTQSISGLGAGTYTVTVSSAGSCAVAVPVLLTEPVLLTQNISISDATCGSGNGSISATVSGGTVPYSYTWSNGTVLPTAGNLFPGTYSLTVLDANGCFIRTVNLQVNNSNIPVQVFLGNDTTICPGDKLVLDPGNHAAYVWQDNSTTPVFSVTTTGLYAVTVTDASGCTGSDSIRVTVDCTAVFFPSAFTPNSDGLNDWFGPLPSTVLPTLSNYRLNVYGRWGQLVFSTSDPYQKWDGVYKGKYAHPQVYTWVASYTIGNRITETQKGTVTIIR